MRYSLTDANIYICSDNVLTLLGGHAADTVNVLLPFYVNLMLSTFKHGLLPIIHHVMLPMELKINLSFNLEFPFYAQAFSSSHLSTRCKYMRGFTKSFWWKITFCPLLFYLSHVFILVGAPVSHRGKSGQLTGQLMTFFLTLVKYSKVLHECCCVCGNLFLKLTL